ncbi:mannonate dehydratase [Treponema primitia ZAS-2]|uniref:Mannonate dehydratase n=1 Tax=Treponema primitia (strain ATCC BAA-887 / DSM 12427 / ZAS-2) TaxID=545694 RepID=F5YKQ1_TREPZ|nr:mannonate dehydratase [Treponema primitia]AEF84348.1 mannonate dehydratase [Treponema primitia ZAS-2]
MQMTMRWFGTGYDSVKLEYIRQVPGVTGIITTLYGALPGEVWEKEAIAALKAEVETAGLSIAGIESVNIHDAIKTGSPDRDRYIDNYIVTLERLGEAGIHLVCYNFMPVFDWTRTDLSRKRDDGSTTMAYDQKIIDTIDPAAMTNSINAQSKGYVMAGWEPERLGHLKELFEMYQGVDGEKLFGNLQYFLNRIMPVCDKYGINMAIHPDDPAWSVFGLPRIVGAKDQLLRLIKAVDNPHNGVTLCTGSLGTNPKNDIPDIITALKGRIHFAHVRNLRHNSPGDFEESAHLSRDGSLDLFQIIKALYDIGFDGPIRPDHGRAIWGEVSMPGYGLYDRALGATYLNGLWEAIEKMSR